MGPQPDNIHVSRYIGQPCLISKRQTNDGADASSARNGLYAVEGCALKSNANSSSCQLTGAPLVVLQRKHRQDQDDGLPDLSKLVIHAHGAPLIISSPPPPLYPHPPRPIEDAGNSSGESLCSTPDVYDRYVPRIIKPRRRRKKDKKSSRDGGRSAVAEKQLYPYAPSERCSCRTCRPGQQQQLLRRCNSINEVSMNAAPGMELKYFLCRSKSWPPSMNFPSAAATMHQQMLLTATHPPQRPWIPLTHPDRTRPSCIFTVMCYNVLCDKYATSQLYGYCPHWALMWEYRRKGILDEIRHYSADIISLQEVETNQFYNFFMPELKQDGYDGIFSPKSRAKTMNESERKFVDGCAIFFRTNKFSLVKEHLFEFNQLAMANAEGSDDMLNRVMTKDNIGLAALLETKEAAWTNRMPDPMQVCQPVLVCTAHIHWDPEFCDVKLIQTMMLMKELRNIIDEEMQHNFRPGATKLNNPGMPIVLCGDLNSLPKSGVCDFMMQGRIAANHEDFKGLEYKDCLEKLGYNGSTNEYTNEYTHNLNLASVYNSEIMPYTNYTFDFKGIIDYIFYQKQFLTPLGLLGPLDADWMKENKVIGCPHPHVPSDHFPLLCELELVPPTSTSMHSNGMILRR